MKFTEAGPDIAESILAGQQDGKVLFVCGAGVSMTAGLPSFRTLVEQIYTHVGEDWTPHLAENAVMVAGTELTGQYDRVLRCLERRIDASDVRRSRGLRQRIRKAIETALSPEDDCDLSNHSALLRLSRGEDMSPRLITTNFDTLFERAWYKIHGLILPSHAGAAMPRQGTGRFEGVFHLHGRIADPTLSLSETDLVLTSAEFGDAYLRSGWAARYIYDLARSHTLVLVGYQANDPPMRYLLEVLEDDRARYSDLRAVYAFAPFQSGQRGFEEAMWRAKGIEPLPYETLAPDDHSPLYEALREWDRYAVDPNAWREARVRSFLTSGTEAANKGPSDEIAEIITNGDAGLLLGNVSPPSDWWPTLSVRSDLRNKPEVLGAWLATKLNDRTMVKACVAMPPRDHRVYRRALFELDSGRPGVPQVLSWEWHLLSRAAESCSDSSLNWHDLATRIRRRDTGSDIQKSIIKLIAPRLTIRTPSIFGSSDEPKGLESLMQVEFDTSDHYPTSKEILEIWPEDLNAELPLLRRAISALIDALEEAEEIGYLRPFDRSSSQIKLIGQEDPRFEGGFLTIVRLVTGLWARVAVRDQRSAKRMALEWSQSGYLLLTRLLIFAARIEDVFSGSELEAFLAAIPDETFWFTDAKREIAQLLISRWNDLPVETRDTLEERLLKGPSRDLDRSSPPMSDEEWGDLSNYSILRYLEPLRRAERSLSPAAAEKIDVLISQYPAPIPSLMDVRDVGGEGVVQETRDELEKLTEVPDTELFGRVFQGSVIGQPHRGDSLWRALARASPHRALRAISQASEANRPGVLSVLLDIACENPKDEDLQRGLAESLLAPAALDDQHTLADAARWLWRLSASGSDAAYHLRRELAEVWDRLSPKICISADNAELPSDSVTEMSALNSPEGFLASALLRLLELEFSTPDAASTLDWEYRLDLLVTTSGTIGLNARMLLVRDLALLEAVNSGWVLSRLVPHLLWDHPEAPILWQARAGQRIGRSTLFNSLKPAFLQAILRLGDTGPAGTGLATNLVQAALWKLNPQGCAYDIEFPEVRRTLATAPTEVRHSASHVLWRYMNGEPGQIFDRAERWRSNVQPLFHKIWPLDASARDSQSSLNLARMALACGEAFPEAVAEIEPVLVAVNDRSVGGLGIEPSSQSVAFRYPHDLLRLLEAISDPNAGSAPYDLSPILESLERLFPGLRSNEAFRRLNAIRRQRGC